MKKFIEFVYLCSHHLGFKEFTRIYKVLRKQSYHNFWHSWKVYKHSPGGEDYAIAAFLHDCPAESRPSYLNLSAIGRYIEASLDHTKRCDLDSTIFQICDLYAFAYNYPKNFSKVKKEYSEVEDEVFYTKRLEILEAYSDYIDDGSPRKNHYLSILEHENKEKYIEMLSEISYWLSVEVSCLYMLTGMFPFFGSEA